MLAVPEGMLVIPPVKSISDILLITLPNAVVPS